MYRFETFDNENGVEDFLYRVFLFACLIEMAFDNVDCQVGSCPSLYMPQPCAKAPPTPKPVGEKTLNSTHPPFAPGHVRATQPHHHRRSSASMGRTLFLTQITAGIEQMAGHR